MWKYVNSDEMYSNYLSDNNELYHYGVLGMKWGVRRAFYKAYSPEHLKRSAEGVKKDISKLEAKSLAKKQKFAKLQLKASKQMDKGDMTKAGKYFKKASKAMKISNKREKTILHNKKLLRLYEKRLSELDSNTINDSKNKLNNAMK